MRRKVRSRRHLPRIADFSDLARRGVTGEIIKRLLSVEGPKPMAQIHKAVKSHYKAIGLKSKAPTYHSAARYVVYLVELGLVQPAAQGPKVALVGLDLRYRYYEIVEAQASSPLWKNPVDDRQARRGR